MTLHHHGQPARDPEGAVAVFVRRRVRPGCEAAYEERLRALMEYTRHLPGYLGGSTQRPREGAAEYTSVIRFDSVGHLQDFEQSERRQAFVADVAKLVEAPAEVQRITGLEVWFVPPAQGPAGPPAQPVRWRMALVLVVVVYSLITMLSALVGPHLGGLPQGLRMLAVVFVQVLAMTYVVMPSLTRWLAPWLFPRPTQRRPD